ncbi:hypothetical protein ID875_21070 [Streptomyces globisporus]|uniref:Uncharacterized protein n=1 Tax=Streptomyces globisporus TaxID=1908 RepID=A0A927BNI7_STRGL|nr:hypothetical protein [Streptomyces globisporus]
MSQMLHTTREFVTLAAENPVIPGFSPSLPGALQNPTGKILGWTAGIGLSLAVLGGLTGWACVAIGHNTERGQLASRGKSAIVWSLIAGVGIGVTSGLVWGFYSMTQGK